MKNNNKFPFEKFFKDRGAGEESFLSRKFLPPHILYFNYHFSISDKAAPITVANCESSGVTK